MVYYPDNRGVATMVYYPDNRGGVVSQIIKPRSSLKILQNLYIPHTHYGYEPEKMRTVLYRSLKVSKREPRMKHILLLSLSLFTIVIFVMFFFGCSMSVEEANQQPDTVLLPTQSDVAPADDLTGTTCPMTNATQACVCDSAEGVVPGRQVCIVESGWGECQCDAAPETLVSSSTSSGDSTKNKIPASFVWQKTVPSGGSCKAGRYDGGFDGIYIPAITFGFGPIPVFGGVSFQLGESSNGEYFQVEDGHMVGSALVAFLFEGDIVGTLDCASRIFEGRLKNCYYVIPGLPPFSFEGVIRAEYDKFNNAFVNGVWSVTEIDANGNFPDPLAVSPGVQVPFPPPLGGTGTWTNQWIP
jgi:hypothetical protein